LRGLIADRDQLVRIRVFQRCVGNLNTAVLIGVPVLVELFLFLAYRSVARVLALLSAVL
jgi:hypothetical protein